jgi:hypothetical protein
MKTLPAATGCSTESPVPEEAAAESAGAAPAVPRTPYGEPPLRGGAAAQRLHGRRPVRRTPP